MIFTNIKRYNLEIAKDHIKGNGLDCSRKEQRVYYLLGSAKNQKIMYVYIYIHYIYKYDTHLYKLNSLQSITR